MAKHKGSGRYVVQHTMLDAHPNGTILTPRGGSDPASPRTFPDTETDRLVKLGAIRELTADEAEAAGDDAERISGPTPPVVGGVSPAVTTEEKDARIQMLERRLGDVEGKLGFYETQVAGGRIKAAKGAPDPAEASAAAERDSLKTDLAAKDAEIERLRTSLAEAQQRAAQAQQGEAGKGKGK